MVSERWLRQDWMSGRRELTGTTRNKKHYSRIECIEFISYQALQFLKNIYLSFNFAEDLAEISIESSGRDFVSQETGEPFVGRWLKEDAGRGWGIKLMKNFVDSVSFEKTERGTKVVMVKSVGRSARNSKEDSKTGG